MPPTGSFHGDIYLRVCYSCLPIIGIKKSMNFITSITFDLDEKFRAENNKEMILQHFMIFIIWVTAIASSYETNNTNNTSNINGKYEAGTGKDQVVNVNTGKYIYVNCLCDLIYIISKRKRRNIKRFHL